MTETRSLARFGVCSIIDLIYCSYEKYKMSVRSFTVLSLKTFGKFHNFYVVDRRNWLDIKSEH